MPLNRRRVTDFKYDINDMNTLAKLRGGPKARCLSKKYLGSHINLKWYCPVHGSFVMRPANIRVRSWCQKCAYEKRAKFYPHRLTLSEAIQIAKMNKGKCLSKEYKNTNSKLEWECSKGHHWAASLAVVKKGHWCSVCRDGVGERIVRQILEILFKETFKKIRPDWLINPETGYKLEFDGYNERLKIAFEYQGIQHIKPDGFYVSNNKAFKKRYAIDQIKKKIAKKQGITLLAINEIKHVFDLNTFKAEIEKELIKNKVKFSKLKLKKIKPIHINMNSTKYDDYLKKLRAAVSLKNGKIIGTFLNSQEPVEFKCSNKNHNSFLTRPTYVVAGSWCDQCGLDKIGSDKRLKINTVKKISEAKGFIFLSSHYKNARTPYRFKCKKCGYIKKAAFDGVRSGSGCPKCAGNLKYTIEHCQKSAIQNLGKCLSKKYYGARVPIWWQCKLGHKWKAAPSAIISQGTWCQKCYYQRKKINK